MARGHDAARPVPRLLLEFTPAARLRRFIALELARRDLEDLLSDSDPVLAHQHNGLTQTRNHPHAPRMLHHLPKSLRPVIQANLARPQGNDLALVTPLAPNPRFHIMPFPARAPHSPALSPNHRTACRGDYGCSEGHVQQTRPTDSATILREPNTDPITLEPVHQRMSQHQSETPDSPPEGEKPQRLLGDLRRRVLGWMLLVSLLPVLVMAVQGYHCAMQALLDRTAIHLAGVADERAARLQAWIAGRQATVERAAAMRVPREILRGPRAEDALAGLLDDALASDDFFAGFALYAQDGRVVASSGMELHAASGDATWMRHPESGDILAILRHPIPARDGSGQSQGTLAGFLNLSKGFDQLLQAHEGRGETIVFKAYALEHALSLGPEGGDALAAGGLAGPDSAEGSGMARYTGPSGIAKIGAAKTIDDPRFGVGPIRLVAETQEAKALAWLGRLRFRAAVTGLITLVVLVFFSLWISDRLGRPLAELARVANRIRHGHVEERLEPMRGAEAEEVRRAVNQMLDESLRQQQALVRNATLASVGELSSSIVHEMRNPLSSIKMNLQGLERGVQDDEQYRELAQIASEQVRRVEGMLDDLLQYGRPVEARLEATTFKELADAALAMVYDSAKSKGVRIECDDQLEGATVHVDREQMCRALTNLLLNAVQASPEEGTVTLRARPAPDSLDRVFLDVLDSGAGLAHGTEGRLFKPFFTTKPNGTGLGLANVKKIMDLHGGVARAENRPEGGALFRLELPTGRDR